MSEHATPHRIQLQRLDRGHYRHLPSGYEVVRYVLREGPWRVVDGGGYVKHTATTLSACRKWIEESPDA